MPSPHDRWLDEEAGPVVRPYRAHPRPDPPYRREPRPDRPRHRDPGHPADPVDLGPEHFEVLRLCRLPASVADLAADLNLPVGVIRILISDLRDRS